MKNLYDIFSISEEQSILFQESTAYECIMDGNYGSALYHVLRILHDELKYLPKINNDFSAYRFIGLPSDGVGSSLKEQGIIKDIYEERMTLANPMNFNDPLDPIIKIWVSETKKRCSKELEKKMYMVLEQAIRYMRIGCMAKEHSSNGDVLRRNSHLEPYKNTLMWGHYANGHRGICIRYKIKKDVLDLHTDDNKILTFGDIRYRNYKAMSGYITFDNALLAKTADWRYECEGRLIYISNNTEEFRDGRGNIIEYTPLDGFKIEAVYLGTRINKVHEKIVLDAAKSINVPVYKMIFNLNNLTDLQPYLIG